MPRRDNAPRDLLFGLLALQHGIVSRDQLVMAFGAWTGEAGKTLADLLAEQGALDAPLRALLEAIADAHLKLHGGDPERSLAALDVNPSTRESLASAGGPEVEATLAHVGGGSGEGDADQTASFAIGTATADGQRFRVLRPHARGGLGAVFVALDSELNREVALKQILDHHADDPASRQRFLIEAEITGGLEHPGIVPVYGLGTYDGGRPYYAMRFIKGDSLKEAIEQHHRYATLKAEPGRRSLELRKLLRRFTDVCNALDYAHSRGVLHRDVKPGNIIVGKYGETLVVDWGLAKPLGRVEPGMEGGERTLVPSSASGSAETLPGSALGTPAYMSPEQASGQLDRLGPRSDVYSLGATLYCLLTGKPPFESNDIGEVLRKVQRGEFIQPRQLDPSIDKALEAVCLRAMAVEQDGRYATSRALAEDVERWMADEPVSAWREPLGRRATRWMKQHRTSVTAVAAAILVALAGTAAVLAVQTRANVRLNAANTALLEANRREQERFDLATDAIRAFHTGVTEDLLLKEGRFKELRNKLLRGAVTFYGRLETILEGQKDRRSRAALGKAYEELSDLNRRVSTNPESIAIARKALAVWQGLAAEPGSDGDAKLGVARSLRAVGTLNEEAGDVAAGLTAARQSRKLVVDLIDSGAGTDRAWSQLGMIDYSIATTLHRTGKLDEAMASYKSALEVQQRLANAHPADVAYKKAVIRTLCNSGVLLTTTGEIDRGLASYTKARSLAESVTREAPDDVEAQSNLGWINNAIAVVFLRLGKQAEAMRAFEQSLVVRQSLADANPNVVYLQGELAVVLLNMGGLLSETGKPAESIAASRRALEVYRQLAATNPDVPEFQSRLAVIQSNMGTTLKNMGHTGEATASYEEALRIQQRLVDANPSIAGYRSDLAEMRDSFGALLVKIGRPDLALESLTAARDIWQSLADANPTVPDYQSNLASTHGAIGRLQSETGRQDQALASQKRSVAIYRPLAEKEPVPPSVLGGLARSLKSIGVLERAAGHATEATNALREARVILERIPDRGPDDLYQLACTLSLLAEAARNPDSAPNAEGPRELTEKAWSALQEAVGAGFKDPDTIRNNPDLAQLRDRPEFRVLMMDLSMPADPFAAAR